MRKLKKKIFGAGVIALMIIVAIVPVTNSIHLNKNDEKENIINNFSNGKYDLSFPLDNIKEDTENFDFDEFINNVIDRMDKETVNEIPHQVLGSKGNGQTADT